MDYSPRASSVPLASWGASNVTMAWYSAVKFLHQPLRALAHQCPTRLSRQARRLRRYRHQCRSRRRSPLLHRHLLVFVSCFSMHTPMVGMVPNSAFAHHQPHLKRPFPRCCTWRRARLPSKACAFRSGATKPWLRVASIFPRLGGRFTRRLRPLKAVAQRKNAFQGSSAVRPRGFAYGTTADAE